MFFIIRLQLGFVLLLFKIFMYDKPLVKFICEISEIIVLLFHLFLNLQTIPSKWTPPPDSLSVTGKQQRHPTIPQY